MFDKDYRLKTLLLHALVKTFAFMCGATIFAFAYLLTMPRFY